MYIGIISIRYARALLTFANDTGQATFVYPEALTLYRNVQEIGELRRLMDEPILTREEKLDILTKASGGNLSDTMYKFLTLVLKNKREKFLMYILQSFIELYRKQEKIRVGKLTTAVPIAPEEVERIRRIVVDHAGGTAEFTTKVDPSIEGGFIFEINTYRLNASVADQMRRIRQQFIEKNRRIV